MRQHQCRPAGGPGRVGRSERPGDRRQGHQVRHDHVKVPAGKAFQLTFDNEDGAPHNVAIYTDSSASQATFQGDIFSSGTRVYDVPALTAGSYFFRCDVHPDMTGTIVAE